MYNKSTRIYKAESVGCLINKIKNKTIFKNCTELEALYKKQQNQVTTGVLHRYDNKKFRDAVIKFYKTSDNPNILDNAMNFSNTIIY